MYDNIFVIYNIYEEEMGKFAWEIFLLGAGNLMRSNFDHLNLFESKKNVYWTVNIEQQLKLKLVWPVCTKILKLK